MDSDYTVSDVISVIDCLTRSAHFSDSVSPAVLRHTTRAFKEALCVLFNFSWRHGVLPLAWRSADVFPIYKGKGTDPNHPKSYRPISLTCSLVKILERLLLHRLVPFLESSAFFNRFQAGFRRDHSTLDQLYRLVDRIQTALSSRHYVSVAYLDIVSAFDTVWHDGLLFKLSKAGVHGRAWLWIRAFLSGRRLRVTHSNCKSSYYSTSAGVPQGSILGPILFLVFINDIPCASDVLTAIFADDVALWPRLDGVRGDRALSTTLSLVQSWATKWHVIFSATKSVAVCYHRKRTMPTPLPLSLGSSVIPFSDTFAYLGLLTHRSLRWRPHENRTMSSASLAAHNVCRVIHAGGPSARAIRQLVLTTVLPIITYGFPIWQPSSKASWAKLESVFCLPLRTVLGLPVSVHRLSLLHESGVQGLRRLHQLRAVSFASRLFKLHYDHPSHELFVTRQRERLNSQPSYAKSRIPFSASLACAEAEFRLKHQSATRKALYASSFDRQALDLKDDANGSFYKTLMPHRGPDLFFRYDPRPTATIRARFRLNRARTNALLFRCGETKSPACSLCSAPFEDTAHVLLDCPAYATSRALCQSEFARLQLLFSVDTVLGRLPSWLQLTTVRSGMRDALLASGTFLQSLDSIRQL